MRMDDKRFPEAGGGTRAVLWDVYGTLLDARRGDLVGLVRRGDELRSVFGRVIGHFGLRDRPADLHGMFLGTIEARLGERRAAGVDHPEIRIEDIWRQIAPGVDAREIALCFERWANPKRGLADAAETLRAIRGRGLRQGIISNAQFYTLIELSELLEGDWRDVFDPELVILSCDLGVAKPDPEPFQRAAAVLAGHGIAPSGCLFVGDSAANDIAPARRAGFRAVRIGAGGDIVTPGEVMGRL